MHEKKFMHGTAIFMVINKSRKHGAIAIRTFIWGNASGRSYESDFIECTIRLLCFGTGLRTISVLEREVLLACADLENSRAKITTKEILDHRFIITFSHPSIFRTIKSMSEKTIYWRELVWEDVIQFSLNLDAWLIKTILCIWERNRIRVSLVVNEFSDTLRRTSYLNIMRYYQE